MTVKNSQFDFDVLVIGGGQDQASSRYHPALGLCADGTRRFARHHQAVARKRDVYSKRFEYGSSVAIRPADSIFRTGIVGARDRGQRRKSDMKCLT